MTGNQLKLKLKENGIRQEDAANTLGITLRTLQNWFKLKSLDANMMVNIKNHLNIGEDGRFELLDCAVLNNDVVFVPLLPISAQGGTLNDFIVSVKDSDCERVVSPIKGADFAMTVAGDSMTPEYPSGAQILIKKINERAFIDWGKVYVLDTCNGTVIKRIFPSEDSAKLKCVSINPEYPPFEVELGDVFGVYRVLLCMSVK